MWQLLLFFLIILWVCQYSKQEQYRPYYDVNFPPLTQAYAKYQIPYTHPQRDYEKNIFERGDIYPFDQVKIY